jgi:MoaA/NifB/PqqE/SkfB family radical SAM enzyme
MSMAAQKKIRELRGLLSGKIAYVGPSFVDVDITKRCNLKCPGCRYHSPHLNIPPHPGDQTVIDIDHDLFKKVCYELKTVGTKSLTLIGEGEPFLHAHISDFIYLAKKLGFYLTVFTNGTFLEENSIHHLIECKTDVVKVGLWASSIEEYEQVYPSSNSDTFNRIVKGLRLLSSAKSKIKKKAPAVWLHYPITHFNYDRINAMVDLADKTGCDVMSFHPFVNRQRQQDSFVLSKEEERLAILSLRKAKNRLDALHIEHNVEETVERYAMGEGGWKKLPCYIGWFHAQIKPDGTVLPCNRVDMSMGNLKEKSFQEIWNDTGYQIFRRQNLKKGNIATFGNLCDCTFCCHSMVNSSFHKKMRWLLPLCRIRT